MKLEHFKRFLAFIPFAVLSLIGVLFLWFKYLINFIRFGGETITYTHKNERKTIRDVYNIIEDMMKGESINVEGKEGDY